MSYKGIPRKESANIEELSPEVKSFAQKLADKFPEDLLVTDGKRSSKASYGATHSHHHHGNAIDIRPNSKVYNFLMNTEEGLSWLTEAGLGVYDETDPRNMKVATGAHFHIGKDTKFVAEAKSRLDLLRTEGAVPKKNYFLELNPDFDYKKFSQSRDQFKKESNGNFDFQNFATSYLSTEFGGGFDPLGDTDELVSYAPTLEAEEEHDHSSHSEIEDLRNEVKRLIDKDVEADKERERKLQENEKLMKLKQEEETKLGVLKSLMEQDYYVERTPVSSSQQNSQAPIQYNPIPTVTDV